MSDNVMSVKENDIQEKSGAVESQAKKNLVFRGGAFLLKSTSLILGLAIVSGLFLYVAMNHGESIFSVGDLIEEYEYSFLATRLFFYFALSMYVPSAIFSEALKNNDDRISSNAKKIKSTFTYIFGAMFLFGELFFVQNILGG